jgi:hypothetical protein
MDPCAAMVTRIASRVPHMARKAPGAASEMPRYDQPHGIPPGAAHLDDWRAFLAPAARRYPQALGFEIWNEPDVMGLEQ